MAEALACSKPVLISNQVNIWREVLEGGGGLVDHNTLVGTRRLLLQWLDMPEEMQQQIAQKAQYTFETYFKMYQGIQRLNNVFASLQQA